MREPQRKELRPPFVIVVLRAGRALFPVTSEARRLVMFEQAGNALSFSQAVVDAGCEVAVASGSDPAMVAVLSEHDPDWPLTFEIEVAPDLEEEVQRQVAYEFGSSVVWSS